MKIIVTDNSDLRIVIYVIPNERIYSLLSENEDSDRSEIIEDILYDYHKLSEINWMILEDDFTIENIEL
jgi:hypothetical protein